MRKNQGINPNKRKPFRAKEGICIYGSFVGNKKIKDKATEKGKDSLNYYHHHKFDNEYDEFIE